MNASDSVQAKSLSAPPCFGILEEVFPLGTEGLRQSPPRCMGCSRKTECLRTALRGPQGLAFRGEKLKAADNAGLLGFWSRWSRKKHLHRMSAEARKKDSEPNPGEP